MPMQLTKDTLFAPKPSKAETKNDVTTQVARAIIDAETAARQAKSQRLRELRLKKEAEEVGKPPAKKPASRR
ncbi:MAG TPA: hypothetical protein VFT89_05585, partial [Rhizobiaceae bacterium]|nr:hypothetical protein [Rhizobiaceae bacterium]